MTETEQKILNNFRNVLYELNVMLNTIEAQITANKRKKEYFQSIGDQNMISYIDEKQDELFIKRDLVTAIKYKLVKGVYINE